MMMFLLNRTYACLTSSLNTPKEFVAVKMLKIWSRTFILFVSAEPTNLGVFRVD